MSFQITPTVLTEPVQSQTGGINARVEPVHNAASGSLLAIGSGLQQIGQATTAAAAHFQDQVDIAQSLRHRNLYATESENVMRNPDTGFLSTVGMDANGDRRKQTFTKLKEQRQKIEALATTDTQRMNFADYADRMDAEANLQADIHQQREVNNFRAGETKVAAEIGIKRGIQLFGTDEGDIAVAGAMRDINTLADLYGLPKDSKLRESMKQDATNHLHMGVIQSIVKDNPTRAGEYLAAHEKELDPENLAKARDLVRGNSDDLIAERLALSLGRTGQSEQDQIATAAHLFEKGDLSVDAYKGAIARIRSNESERYRQKAQGYNDSTRVAEDWLKLNGANSFDELPAEVRTSLKESGGENAIKALIDGGGQWGNKPQGLSDLLSYEANPGLLLGAKSWDVVEAKYRPLLNNAGMGRLASLWHDAHQQPNKTAFPVDQVNTMVRLAAVDHGMIPGDAPPKGVDVYRMDRLEFAVKQRLRDMGGPINEKAVKQVIDEEFASSLRTQSGWFSSGKVVPFGAATPAEKNAGTVDTVYGPVQLSLLTPEREQSIIDYIKTKNAMTRELNATLPPGSFPKPLIPENPQSVADEFGRRQAEARSEQAVIDDAANRKRVGDLRRFGLTGEPVPNFWERRQ